MNLLSVVASYFILIDEAFLSQALYLAEQKAREAVETRARIQHELLNNEKERKEDELRKLAQQARMDRVGGNPMASSHDDHGKAHLSLSALFQFFFVESSCFDGGNSIEKASFFQRELTWRPCKKVRLMLHRMRILICLFREATSFWTKKTR